MDDGQPHDAGYLIAIRVQLLESPDAPGFQVRTDALDHLEKILVRDMVARHRVDEGRPQCMFRRSPVKGGFEILTPARDGAGAIGYAFFIAQVIALIIAIAHERVDGAHGAALFRG